jgi:hypothetical protein
MIQVKTVLEFLKIGQESLSRQSLIGVIKWQALGKLPKDYEEQEIRMAQKCAYLVRFITFFRN